MQTSPVKITTYNSWVPIRAEPKSVAENVSSLLFGETAVVLDANKEWFKIKMDYDGYEGWLGKEYVLGSNGNLDLRICTSKQLKYQGKFGAIHIPVGGEFAHSSITVGGQVLELQDHSDSSVQVNPKMIGPHAIYHFLHVPYLWGGRSIHGIDCSGLVQVCMKMAGISFPRDTGEQVKKGDLVEYGNHQINDLAFFQKNNKVMHVGIILNDDQIIHASGRVRIDTLTSDGIYNSEMQRTTHAMHSIRRVKV